jgi:hypothetical protein
MRKEMKIGLWETLKSFMEKKKTQLRISEDLKKHDDEKEMKN